MNSFTRILLEDLLEIKNQDYIIYFDIDDTLTDYSNRLGNMIITDPETGEKRPIKSTDTVDNIEFWTSAKWLPGSKQMFDFAKNNFSNVEILSAVPELSKANKELTGKRFFDDPINGKIEWLNKNIGSIKTIWTKSGKEKAIYATPNTILIDDKPENIKAFKQAGGIGILMDTPQNVINKLNDLLEGKEITQEGIIDDTKSKLKKFILAVKQEGQETRAAVGLIIKSAKGEITLTDEQKKQIGEQLKDILKLVGLTAIATLPGGFIVGALIKLFKAEHLITPSSMMNELVTDTEVICDNCGWEWPIADGGDDLYICHKCGHDNNPDLEEGSCGYDTDVATGKKLNTPGGLEEGKQVGPLYHYTSADGLKGILSSNRINASEEYYLGNDLYYISFTRNKNFHNKGSKFGVKTEYRITLDGNKLSNKYKIKPFAYTPGWNYEDNWEYDWLEDEPENVVRDFFNNTGDYDEQEERISFKGPEGGIDNIKNYILTVDKVKDLQEGRKKKSDPKKGTGKKPEKSGRRLYTDEDPKDTVSIKFKTKEDIVDTLNKTSFKAKPHARQSQVINLIHQRVRAAYGKAKDPEVKARLKRALDYIEKRKEMSKKKTERLNKMKEASDPQAGTALPYGSGFAPVKENDPFGLNELARQFMKETLKEMWKPEESFVSLSKYMIDNGMNIKPLPKIKVISDDKDNASNLLGKTAYYNPTDKSITLYTMDRHPKDILRSFSHEMVHHMQNLEGRLNNINTTNTNKDGALPEIEEEAYKLGNMMLRKWEDSIKDVQINRSI
jgi:hypothetical protein